MWGSFYVWSSLFDDGNDAINGIQKIVGPERFGDAFKETVALVIGQELMF